MGDYWQRKYKAQRQREYERQLPYLAETAVELAREGDFSRLEHAKYLIYDLEGREKIGVTLEELEAWFRENPSDGR